MRNVDAKCSDDDGTRLHPFLNSWRRRLEKLLIGSHPPSLKTSWRASDQRQRQPQSKNR